MQEYTGTHCFSHTSLFKLSLDLRFLQLWFWQFGQSNHPSSGYVPELQWLFVKCKPLDKHASLSFGHLKAVLTPPPPWMAQISSVGELWIFSGMIH